MNKTDGYKSIFMERAVNLALEGSKNGHGGPFGAVVVRNGEVLGEGFSKVTSSNDPTAHAEVVAIRMACEKLKSYQLDGCDIYCSCEPCPMCLGAIYWARLARVFYASTKSDASDAGFDDQFIYDELSAPVENRKIPMFYVKEDKAMDAFGKWKVNPFKVKY